MRKYRRAVPIAAVNEVRIAPFVSVWEMLRKTIPTMGLSAYMMRGEDDAPRRMLMRLLAREMMTGVVPVAMARVREVDVAPGIGLTTRSAARISRRRIACAARELRVIASSSASRDFSATVNAYMPVTAVVITTAMAR